MRSRPDKKSGRFLFPALVPTTWTGDCAINDVATLKGMECLFSNVLRTALPLVGLALGIMLVIGGFKLITSGGEQEKIAQAKNTFTHAIFGLVVVILLWFFLVFIKEFTGIKVTEFNLP